MLYPHPFKFLYFLSQRWPVFIALLSREDFSDRRFICRSGVWRLSGRFGAGCDRYGSLHSAARLRPGYGQSSGWLHGVAWGEIHQEVRSCQGLCQPLSDLRLWHIDDQVLVIKHSGDSAIVFQIEELEAGTPGRLKVTAKSTESDEIIEGEYNTVSGMWSWSLCFHLNISKLLRTQWSSLSW